MHTITFTQFQATIRAKEKELHKMLEIDLPKIIGKEAVDIFKENFATESWGRKKWKEVQRRKATWMRAGKEVPNPLTEAKRTRKILAGDTANLKRSIIYDAEKGKVTISSNVVYAAVHNFGLRAGRGAGFTMPQRQFIGDNKELQKKIEEQINNKLEKIFNS